jgi:hypothetical protein
MRIFTIIYVIKVDIWTIFKRSMIKVVNSLRFIIYIFQILI